MNALDIALITLLVVPAMLGLFKGLVNVAVAFIGLWLGFVVAGLLAPSLAPALGRRLGQGPLTEIVAYGLLFVGTLLAAGLLGLLVTRSLRAMDLQWVNRLAGALTGLCCGLLLGGVVVGGVRAVAPESALLAGSALAPPVAAVTSFAIAIPRRLASPAAPASRPADAAPAAPPASDGDPPR